MKTTSENILLLLGQVSDPEIPVLSIIDLGIVRDVIVSDEGEVEVVITPTYSGCPAMDVIAVEIKMKLLENGWNKIKITYALDPSWTTDWMSEEGKEKLKNYGIAPPQHLSSRIESLLFSEDVTVPCPRCKSTNTRKISEFGSTACKALYCCDDCKEPFDYFKCH